MDMPMEKVHPTCWCNRGEQGTATGPQSSGAALRRTSSRDTYTVYRSRIPVRVTRVVSAGTQRHRQQPAATQDQGHSLPVAASLGKQDPKLPLLHLEDKIYSTHLPSPEKNKKDRNVISQTGPSHMLETSTQLGRHASQETYIKHWSRIPVRVSRVVSTGIQRPSQQPRAQQDQAHSMPMAASWHKQDPKLPLLHLEDRIYSTHQLSPEKNNKDRNVISQTELSHVLETSTQLGHHTSQETFIKYWSRIPVRVSRVVSAGIQRPSQQPRAQQDQAHSMPMAAPLGRLPGTCCQRQVSGQDTEILNPQQDSQTTGL